MQSQQPMFGVQETLHATFQIYHLVIFFDNFDLHFMYFITVTHSGSTIQSI